MRMCQNKIYALKTCEKKNSMQERIAILFNKRLSLMSAQMHKYIRDIGMRRIKNSRAFFIFSMLLFVYSETELNH